LRRNVKGFTLVEMIAGLTIGAILILMIGGISSICQSSFENLRKESGVYGDVFYGFNLIKFSVRKAQGAINISNEMDPNWKSQVLTVDNSAFGLYQPPGTKTEFVYLKNKSDTSNRDIFMEVDSNKNETIGFIPTQNGKIVTVRVYGQKDKESFDLSTSVMRRN
jgi:prepilin-type N-terminal cleavage/methylation domain-containing protein